MKKIVNKNTIFTFILGVIVSGVTVYAVSNAAKDITFKAGNTNWKVGNVADALDSLYISKTTDNYSTSEKVVGTWVDGKPLYQKTFAIDTTPSTEIIYDLTSWNIDWVIDYKIIVKNEAINIEYYGDDNDRLRPLYYDTTKELKIWRGKNYPIGLGYITLQYTKTTDSATNN